MLRPASAANPTREISGQAGAFPNDPRENNIPALSIAALRRRITYCFFTITKVKFAQTDLAIHAKKFGSTADKMLYGVYKWNRYRVLFWASSRD